MSSGTTIVALSTPPGSGALAVVRMSGPKAIAIGNNVFKGSDLRKSKSMKAHFGEIVDENWNVVDEAVALIFKAPRTYTREDIVEFSLHGSSYIIQETLRLCQYYGAVIAQPGEFTMRAFLNGRIDLSQAEAVADLIASQTEASHNLAVRQLKGGISKEIEKLRQELIDFAALIELELDFGEEDVEFADRNQLTELINKIRAVIKNLNDSFHLGNAIKHGVLTVIAGRPNAGKSTLLNALVGENRAIVSDIAGTTRDTIEAVLNIDGIPFRLIDTAGIREATDTIEALGVERTLDHINRSAILVYVYDPTAITLNELESDLDQFGQSGKKILTISNKSDIAKALGNDHFSVSALKQIGLDALKSQLLNAVVSDNRLREETVISTARHQEALKNADEALEQVQTGVDGARGGELLSLEIRRALQSLGEITGQVTTDDLLESIFSRFCIGK